MTWLVGCDGLAHVNVPEHETPGNVRRAGSDDSAEVKTGIPGSASQGRQRKRSVNQGGNTGIYLVLLNERSEG